MSDSDPAEAIAASQAPELEKDAHPEPIANLKHKIRAKNGTFCSAGKDGELMSHVLNNLRLSRLFIEYTDSIVLLFNSLGTVFSTTTFKCSSYSFHS